MGISAAFTSGSQDIQVAKATAERRYVLEKAHQPDANISLQHAAGVMLDEITNQNNRPEFLNNILRAGAERSSHVNQVATKAEHDLEVTLH